MSTPPTPALPTLAQPINCCPVCCDFDSAFAGKTMTYTYTYQDEPSGSGIVRVFTGAYLGGGQFVGNSINTLRHPTGSVGTTCFGRVWATGSTSSSFQRKTYACSIVDGLPQYGLLGDDFSIFYGPLEPFTCPGGGFDAYEDLEKSITTSCFSLTARFRRCYLAYNTPPCSGTLMAARGTETSYNLSIA